jgi:ribonuclease HI
MVHMAEVDGGNGFTSMNHPAHANAAQSALPAQQSHPSQPPPTPTSGIKRKRDAKSGPKFYAVRIGKEPGIYHTWSECLDQVRGFPKAIFKSFASLSDAEKFVNNESVEGGETKVTKWYGVRSGRTPGVYTSWQEVLDQITGWKGPKHRGFKTKWEAEQYVAEGDAGGDTVVPSVENGDGGKKAKKAKKSGGIKDEMGSPPLTEQGEYEPGEAPLRHDAEDGFDSDIVLDHTTNSARYKTREERERVTYEAVRPVRDAPIRIYTDGSSLSNGRANAWGGVGVYFGPADKRNISEPLSGTKQTNQRAELMAMVRALEVAPKDRRIVIVSDSKYSIDCVTDWFRNWQRNNWVNSSKKAVENKDLVQKILEQLEERLRLNQHRMSDGEDVISEDKRSYWDRGPGGVKFEWVKGHDKDEGNSAADVLAVAGARTAQELGRDVDFDG